MNKNLCDCGKVAQWCYMPSPSYYICDECLYSSEYAGCSCNWYHTDVNAYTPPIDNPDIPEGIEGSDWKWVNEKKDCWEYVDKKGRPYPCCEFEYNEDGWEEYFFEKLKKIDNNENWQESLELLFHYFDNWLNSSQFDICNVLINSFLSYDFSLRLHLGLLTATNRRKNNLAKYGDTRQKLYDKTEKICLLSLSEEQTKVTLRQLK